MLATYGVDSKGRLFVRVKVHKQNRLYGEVIARGGEVLVHCRNCLRWHRVVFREHDVQLTEDQAAEPRHPSD